MGVVLTTLSSEDDYFMSEGKVGKNIIFLFLEDIRLEIRFLFNK